MGRAEQLCWAALSLLEGLGRPWNAAGLLCHNLHLGPLTATTSQGIASEILLLLVQLLGICYWESTLCCDSEHEVRQYCHSP